MWVVKNNLFLAVRLEHTRLDIYSANAAISTPLVCSRYSAQRQQFGPPGGAEVSVLDYQTQQMRLIPILAHAYALHFARDALVAKYCEMKRTKDPRLVEEVHALSAGEGGPKKALLFTSFRLLGGACAVGR